MIDLGRLLHLARSAKLTIACAESCTGGLLAASLTEMAGASDVFDRGFVTYSNQAKIDMLGVLPQSLAEFGAVSEQVAREMADGARARANVGLAVSITGIAGPGASTFKPEGRVCFGLAHQGFETRVQSLDFGALGRDKVRQAARDHALELLLAALEDPA